MIESEGKEGVFEEKNNGKNALPDTEAPSQIRFRQ
jgi:hypothetical protein